MFHLTKVVPVRKTIGRTPESTPDRDARIALSSLRLNLNVRAVMLNATAKAR